MTTVVLLALASTTCAAISTVLKHRSANRHVQHSFGGWLPQLAARMVANPMFLLALAFDGGALTLQVLALRYGNLSTVQPILTLVLVISLALDHAVARTRVTQREMIWAATLVCGLVLFLVSSGATHPQGGRDVGDRAHGLVLAGLGVVAWAVALGVTRHARPSVRARTMAVGVAAIYAATAGLIKSSTRIYDHLGFVELARSWQLWVLLTAGVVGLVLNQHVFSMAPLHVTLPVIASLDPLFSVLIGWTVFDERLLATPLAIVTETVGLALLLVGVVRLSRSASSVVAADPAAGARA